jgi:hypothetical protein
LCTGSHFENNNINILEAVRAMAIEAEINYLSCPTRWDQMFELQLFENIRPVSNCCSTLKALLFKNELLQNKHPIWKIKQSSNSS